MFYDHSEEAFLIIPKNNFIITKVDWIDNIFIDVYEVWQNTTKNIFHTQIDSRKCIYNSQNDKKNIQITIFLHRRDLQ